MKITTAIVCITILYRLIDIYKTRDFYKKRVDYIGELLEKTKKLKGTKFLVEEKLIKKDLLLQTWGFGYETLYGHLSKYKCRAGQRVKRGDVIGYVGNTGRSEGPHLHYEVHKDGKVVNPLNFYYGNISAVEYVAIAQLANQENQSLD